MEENSCRVVRYQAERIREAEQVFSRASVRQTSQKMGKEKNI